MIEIISIKSKDEAAFAQNLKEAAELEQLCFSEYWTKDQIEASVNDFINPCVYNEGLLAKAGGVTAGYILYSVIIDKSELFRVCVKPEFRRQGIAEALIEKMIARVSPIVSEIFLEVREENLPARTLYEKMQFSEISVRKNYYGNGKNAIIYRREFEEEDE